MWLIYYTCSKLSKHTHSQVKYTITTESTHPLVQNVYNSCVPIISNLFVFCMQQIMKQISGSLKFFFANHILLFHTWWSNPKRKLFCMCFDSETNTLIIVWSPFLCVNQNCERICKTWSNWISLLMKYYMVYVRYVYQSPLSFIERNIATNYTRNM